MLKNGSIESVDFETAATMLATRPATYFSRGGSERSAHFLLTKFGFKFFKDSFAKLAYSLCSFRCFECLRVVLSWVRRDEFIKEKRIFLLRVAMTGNREGVRLLVDSGADFYATLETISPVYNIIPKRKRLEQTAMRRVHCQQTVRALLAVKKMGLLRNQDRFVIQTIALVLWTTRWKWDWNKGGVLRPNPQDRFFERPIY